MYRAKVRLSEPLAERLKVEAIQLNTTQSKLFQKGCEALLKLNMAKYALSNVACVITSNTRGRKQMTMLIDDAIAQGILAIKASCGVPAAILWRLCAYEAVTGRNW